MPSARPSLLRPGDPAPFVTENARGASPLLFVSDHAGPAIPAALGTLGLDAAERQRHIAYDIGIRAVTSRVAAALDAPYVYQPYSRLVIDCNRRPGTPNSIPPTSDGTEVPGNAEMPADAAAAREAEILRPYHAEIAHILAQRAERGLPNILFAMHSCTPRLAMDDRPRPWPIMVMADRDRRLADALVAVLRAEKGLLVGVDEPYTVNAEQDYTIPLHAEANGLPYVEIELRQDLIADEAGQDDWATRLTRWLPRAVAEAGVVPA